MCTCRNHKMTATQKNHEIFSGIWCNEFWEILTDMEYVAHYMRTNITV